MSPEAKQVIDEHIKATKTNINRNTTVSVGVLISVVVVFFKLNAMSNDYTRWMQHTDDRLMSLELEVSSRPDAWSGTMMKEVGYEVQEQVRKAIPDFKYPDVRTIQAKGIRLHHYGN